MSMMSTFKGILGETVINVATWLTLDKAVYHRLNNITLPLANGGSTQIDHVIVSAYGIFVIETKNYKGWIYGKEAQKQWTQAFPNGRKYKFQNPLRQNYLHIKTLADLLALDISYFYSMIAFIGECELKTRDELPEHVLKGGVISYIKKKQDKILTEAEVESIVEQIETKRFAKSWRTNSQHKAYLKDKHADTSKTIDTKQNIESDTQLSTEPNYNQNIKTNSQQSSKPKLQSDVKTGEVFQWSGQVERDDSSTMPFTSKNAVFMTPFDIVEFETSVDGAKVNRAGNTNPNSNQSIMTEQIKEPAIVTIIPSCPKCSSEMIRRVAKQGVRQGQIFFGCSQFPKCRGVVNVGE